MVFLCGCATGRGDRQPFEGINLPFVYEGDKQAWEVGSHHEGQSEMIDEMVRPGQTVESWTELVTCQTYKKTNDLGTVDQMVAAHREDLTKRCPGSTLKVIQHLPDGVLFEVHVMNCEKGADEEMLSRMLDGTMNRFVVSYAVRGEVTMTPERREEWIKKLMGLSILRLPPSS